MLPAGVLDIGSPARGKVGGSGVQSAKSAMSDKASSGSSFGSSSAAAAGGGSTPAAAITGAVGSSVEGKDGTTHVSWFLSLCPLPSRPVGRRV